MKAQILQFPNNPRVGIYCTSITQLQEALEKLINKQINIKEK